MPIKQISQVEQIASTAQDIEQYLHECEQLFDGSLGAVEFLIGEFSPIDKSIRISPRDFDPLTPGLSGTLLGESNPIVKCAISGTPLFIQGHDFIKRAFGTESEIWFEELMISQIWVVPSNKSKVLIGHSNLLTRITDSDKQVLEKIIELLPNKKQTETNKKNLVQHELLSSRQTKILEFMADALTNKQIAKELEISESTVKQETIQIYEILKVARRSEAIKYYYTNLLLK